MPIKPTLLCLLALLVFTANNHCAAQPIPFARLQALPATLEAKAEDVHASMCASRAALEACSLAELQQLSRAATLGLPLYAECERMRRDRARGSPRTNPHHLMGFLEACCRTELPPRWEALLLSRMLDDDASKRFLASPYYRELFANYGNEPVALTPLGSYRLSPDSSITFDWLRKRLCFTTADGTVAIPIRALRNVYSTQWPRSNLAFAVDGDTLRFTFYEGTDIPFTLHCVDAAGDVRWTTRVPSYRSFDRFTGAHSRGIEIAETTESTVIFVDCRSGPYLVSITRDGKLEHRFCLPPDLLVPWLRGQQELEACPAKTES